MYKSITLSTTVALLWLGGTHPAFAFGGCVQASPENPSLLLALLGAGAAAFPLIRHRIRNRKERGDERIR